MQRLGQPGMLFATHLLEKGEGQLGQVSERKHREGKGKKMRPKRAENQGCQGQQSAASGSQDQRAPHLGAGRLYLVFIRRLPHSHSLSTAFVCKRKWNMIKLIR